MERPSLRRLMRDGLVPQHLLEPAVRLADPSWFTADDSTREGRTARLGELMSLLIAGSVRAVQDGPRWQEVTLAADDLDVDWLDRDALEDLVLRTRTPAEITARSRAIRGMPDAPADDDEVAIPGWTGFRGEPGGAAAGTDVGAVGPEPVLVPSAG